MKYVLDTDTFSALMKGNAHALARLTSERRTDVLVPQPVIAEIRFGIHRLPASRRRTTLEHRFAVFGTLIRADWTDDVSFEFGRIKADLERTGQLIEDFDVAIAAHAVAAAATLVSGNARHMSRIPDLTIEDWTNRAPSRAV